MAMEHKDFPRKFVETSAGRVAYVDAGEGKPAVFLHGLGLSAYFWRGQISAFSQSRRCIAFDLLAHGKTEANKGCDVSFRSQARAFLEALRAIGIDKFDLVGSDSGGAIAQIMAVTEPDRLRSLVLTNCDVHDNWPPEALNEIRGAAQAGLLADQFGRFIEHPEMFRAPGGIAEMVYEDPSFATDELIAINLTPIISSPERKAAFNRYAGLQDHSQLTVIEQELRALNTPCLIVWGTDDIFFPDKWALWLADALPAARDVVWVNGAKLFFPEERPDALNVPMGEFWRAL